MLPMRRRPSVSSEGTAWFRVDTTEQLVACLEQPNPSHRRVIERGRDDSQATVNRWSQLDDTNWRDFMMEEFAPFNRALPN